jgi:hypothetical protein
MKEDKGKCLGAMVREAEEVAFRRNMRDKELRRPMLHNSYTNSYIQIDLS